MLASSEALADHVHEVVSRRHTSPMATALRHHTTLARLSRGEAVGLMLAYLHRNLRREKVDLRKLKRLGPEGAKAAALLEELSESPPASGRQMAELLKSVEHGVKKAELAQLRPLFDAAQLSSSPETADVFATTRVAALLGSALSVPFPALLPSLTYGGEPVLEFLAQLSERQSGSRLSLELRSGLLVEEPSPAALAAQLLTLFWGYRVESAAGTLQIHADAFLRRFGEEGRTLLELIEHATQVVQPDRPNYPMMAEIVTTLWQGKEDVALLLVEALVRSSDLIPRSLGPLEKVAAQIPDDALEGKGLIASQHLLTNTVPLLEMLIRKGMDPADIHVHGSPYANNPLVIVYLQMRGMHIVPGGDNLGHARDLKEKRLYELENFVAEVSEARKPPRGWKVLDDGGLLHKVLTLSEGSSYRALGVQSEDYREQFFSGPIEGIEQTTRGLTELGDRLHYPTVAVARAEGKRREAGMIGWALADSLWLELKQRGLPPDQTPVAIVGAGKVGYAAALRAREAGVPVVVVDPNPEVRERAISEGMKAFESIAKALPHVDVALSCSGMNIWEGSGLANWHGLLLSGSSMAVEFDIPQIHAYRSRLKVGNLGRPLNFHGDGHAVLTPDEIAITLALLFIAICQELPPGPPRFHEVDPGLERLAIEEWERTTGSSVRAVATEGRAAVRPDLISERGVASHPAWLSFLSSLRREVNPVPSSVRGSASYYFFEEEGGVRGVDTRVGRSYPVDLPGVPTHVSPLSTQGPLYFVSTREPEGKQRAWLMDLAGGGSPAFRDCGTFDHRECAYVDEVPSAEGQQLRLGLVLSDGDSVQVLGPGETSFRRLPKPGAGDSLWAWVHPGTVLQFAKHPAKLHALVLKSSALFEFWSRIEVPRKMVTVEAVAHWKRQKTLMLVGRNAAGRVLIAPMDPAAWDKPPAPVELPEGATYRGIRPAPNRPYGHFLIDYTLPGDPIELAAYRQLEVFQGKGPAGS